MIKSFAKTNSLPAFRVKQFNLAYYQEGLINFENLSTWPKPLRESAQKEIDLAPLKALNTLESADSSTVKVLFETRDSKYLEAVLMKYKDGRHSVCVSCMIGCPVDCSFCATGKMGFIRNLTASEIVFQVLFFQNLLRAKDIRISNVVFMGMGEPLLNLDAVMEAYETLTNPEKIALGSRHITLSTSGYVPQLKKLIATDYKGRLAVSLHAAIQEKREQIMRVAKIFSLEKLFSALDEYVAKTNKRVSYEYILLKDLNDTKEDAKALITLLKPRLAHVNLIPYNPVLGVGYERSSKNKIFAFKKYLDDAGLPNTLRITMGDDIKAACGQLAGKSSS